MRGKISGPKYCENQLISNSTEVVNNATLNIDGTLDNEIHSAQLTEKVFQRNCFEEDLNYEGFGISDNKILNVQAKEDCQRICEKRFECKFWTLSQNVCWLKSSDQGRKIQKGKISGPKFCIQNSELDNENTSESSTFLVDYLFIQEDEDILNEMTDDTEDNDEIDKQRPLIDTTCFIHDKAIKGFGPRDNQISNVLTAEDCQAECRQREECTHWTWNSGQSPARPLTCYLKSSAQLQVDRVARVSGPRECEERARRQVEEKEAQHQPSPVIYVTFENTPVS